MADLTRHNPPSPPQMQPWLVPLPVPLHQLSSTSCMAQISPFFPRLFKLPSIFPASPPQGFTPPPVFASTLTTPYAIINNYGAYRFAQSGCGIYGAGGSCFVGPYGYLYLPPIQFQLKTYGRLQSGTSMGQHQEQRNRISPSRPRIAEPESRGTGVFHPPDANDGTRNKKRRRKRGKRNENGGFEETAGEGSRRWREEEGSLEQQGEEEWRQSQADYDEVVLPSEWPY